MSKCSNDEISIKIINNTPYPQNGIIFGTVPNLQSPNKDENLYVFDLALENYSSLTNISISISNTSNPTPVIYTLNLPSNNVTGIVSALNTLNMGIFQYVGTTIYVSSPYYIYGALNVNSILADFVSTWNTANTSGGSSASNQVKLPLISTGTYNFVVDWGDGNTDTITTWNQAQTTHTYGVIGSYNISIQGIVQGWSFNNTGDRLKILNVSDWGTLKIIVGNYGGFYGCANLNLATVSGTLDLSTANTFDSFFRDCSSLTNVNNINSWNVSSATNMSNMFQDCAVFNQNISSWNVSNVADMKYMFFGCIAFNQPIGSWNVSNVTDMTLMFYNSIFNQPIGSWNVGNVLSMNEMFYNCTIFNQPIGSWNVSSVIDMGGMFFGCTAFNQSISSWNVSNVTNMYITFAACSNFNQSLNLWDVSSVINMQSLFQAAISFNQDISSWNVSSVTNMSAMFLNATVFNQNISSWNVSSVTNMQGMFNNATSFNQPIGSWNVSSVINMASMFDSATSFNQQINAWNVSNLTFAPLFMANKTSVDYNISYLNSIYNSWSALSLFPNVIINFGTINYTSVATAGRAILTSAPKNWTVTDGGIV